MKIMIKINDKFFLKLGTINTVLCFLIILTLELKSKNWEKPIFGYVAIDAIVFPLITGVSTMYCIVRGSEIPGWFFNMVKGYIIFLFYVFAIFIPYKFISGH